MCSNDEICLHDQCHPTTILICTGPLAPPGVCATVLDGRTREPVCDATVTAVGPTGSSELFWQEPTDSGCDYCGVDEPGVYVVEASRHGRTAIAEVEVIGDECDVATTRVDLTPL